MSLKDYAILIILGMVFAGACLWAAVHAQHPMPPKHHIVTQTTLP